MIIHLDFAVDTLAYVFDGPMTDEKIDELRDDILKKLEEHDKINIYLEDRGIEQFTMYSVIQGIIFPLQNSKRFHRVAMVTDRSWIHLLSSLNKNFMRVSIKNYTTEERVTAMQWVTSGVVQDQSGINLFPVQEVAASDYTFANNTLGYIIEGKMDKASIAELRRRVLEKFEYHDKINLYLEDRNINQFSLSAATIGALFPLEYAKRFDKIALITDRKWIHRLAALDNVFIKATLKYFPKHKRAVAMDWISSK